MVSFGDDIEGVTDIDIDAKILNVQIVEGDKFSYEYDGRDDLKPDIDLNDGKLKISQKGKNVSGLNNNWKSDLTIKIPEDAKLGYFKTDMDMGNLQAYKVVAEDVVLDLDMGNIEINELKAEDIDIDANMGNVEVYKAEFEDLDADANMGNVIIESVKDLDDYSIEASTDMGNLEVNGKKISKKYESNGDDGNIKLKANMGNVSIYSK